MWKSILLPVLLILIVVDMVSFNLVFKLFKGYGRFAYMLLFVVIFETYAFQALQTLNLGKWSRWLYIVANVGLYGFFVYLSLSSSDENKPMAKIQTVSAVMILFLVPKLFLTIPLILEDFLRLISLAWNKFGTESQTAELPERRKFISIGAWGLAAFMFGNILYGVIYGKYRYRVIRKKLYFDDLPESFEGFTITQISDIHSGSFDNPEKVAYGIDMINQQQSDILVFTGDMVNNSYKEMLPYKELFGKLNAKGGMYSVLGNHDYGGYGRESREEQIESQEKLAKIQEEIGFKLLKNEHVSFERNGEKIHIVGVENWGASRHFPKAGNLAKATQDLGVDDFKVLLSHDPSHFDFKEMEIHDRHKDNPEYNKEEKPIVDFEKKVQLTLSGHTHGMQFGIEIPGFIKFSPVSFRYPKWAGLYSLKGRQLYVNRGFGYLAFPGRVGIWPEITVLELCKSKTTAV